MDNASLIDTGWSNFIRGDGTPDRQRMKQAIVNALRVVLLSPRKDLRWNAIHYQDISHIPADTDDSKVYWDTLEKKRQDWNAKQVKNLYGDHVSPEVLETMMQEAATSHQAWRKEWPKFFAIILQQNGGDYKASKEIAEKTLREWQEDAHQHIAAGDAHKPVEKQMSADLIERKATKEMALRMKTFIKDQQQKLDIVAHGEQMGLDINVPEVTPPKIDRYGAFMGTHLTSIAKVSKHADDLLDAALKDVQEHDGSGHHFRSQVLSLGISGVGPKVASFAWLLLQPMTSQLATIDTHMMDVLGHHYDKDMNNRDYFKFERELAAGRDAAGYGHIPLGAFQWGMWDHKRTGPGSHQDHSAMRVLDPVPHDSIDWASKAQNLKGDSWLQQAPDWWRNTQAARDAVAQDFEANVAPSVAQNQIPVQKIADFSKGFKHWWDQYKPVKVEDAKILAEYARGTKTSKKDTLEFLEKHKNEVDNYDKFKEKFMKKFESLKQSSAEAQSPDTHMKRLVQEHGLTTQEIWNLFPDLPPETPAPADPLPEATPSRT